MSKRNLFLLFVVAALFVVATVIPIKSQTNGQVGLIAGRNVNMVSGMDWPKGDPYLQRQNEPSIAVSTRNPLHLLAGSNDYRSIDVQFEDELPGFEKEISAARDAWLGYYTSYDGGQSWTSTLLPGYYHADTTPPGAPPSPLLGYEAAADPVVRAGTNGLFYFCGITFNRGQRGLGQVFVARFIDNNNKETGAIEYIDTKIIDLGNSGHFIDKPTIAVDIPRVGSPTTTLPNGQTVPCGNVYIVYTSFMGDLAEDAHSKMMFSMSSDCGETWSKPTQITDAGQPYQAAALAISPIDGRPYVAYRRFAKDHTDAIMLCWAERKGKESADGYWHGNIKFSKPKVLAEIDPFDQPTSEVTFRTNDYPTMAIDKDGVIYVAWSQRGLGPNGEAKVLMMTSDDDFVTWEGPARVAGPPLEYPLDIGYHFMPSLTSGAGKVMMLWYDQRYDYCDTGFGDQYIQETYPIRHTIDVRAAEVHSIPDPYFTYETIQVSRYPWVFTSDYTGNPVAIQLQYNMPNLPIFGGGTVPFFGDYIDITASPVFIFENGEWTYNTNPNSVYHAVWTDNRDVRPPGPDLPPVPDPGQEGNWVGYVAPEDCTPGYESQTGIRNQNIYTSRITEGIIAGSPGNTKPLNMNRAFVVFVKNATGTPNDLPRVLTLRIVETSGATAYFMKAGVNVGSELDVEVPSQSSVAATVMVDIYPTDEYATVRIDVLDEYEELLTYILLNPDSTNPLLEDPEGYDPESPHVGSEGETHTPHVGSEDVINWTYSLDNPHVGSEDATSPHVGSNDDFVTPHVGSDDAIVEGSTIHVGTNNHIIMSNIVNPHVGSDGFDAIPPNSSMTDIVWTVENRGNTTSTFSLSTFPNYGEYDPSKIAVQLIVYKVYTTPTALGCELKEQEHHELIFSQTSPHVGSEESPEESSTASITSQSVPWYFDATFSIPPKGTGEEEVEYKVILRYMDKDPTDPYEFDPGDQGISVISEAPDIIGGDVIPPSSALVIKTRNIDLDDGIAGTTYNETLEVEGGYENNEYTWTLSGSASTWLSLVGTPISNICNVSGTPPSSGTYQLIVNVENTDSQYNRSTLTATKTLSIRVVNPLQITKTTLYDAFKGGGYVDTLQASGGTQPYIWSIIAGSLPEGLALTPGTNRIEGTVSLAAVTSTFTVQVSDFGNPTLTDSLQITIDVYDPPQITTPLPLPNGTVAVYYSHTLAGTGGNTPYTWSVFSGALPPGLNLNSSTGEINGTPTTEGAYSFQIHMTDSSDPNQTAGTNFSITISATGLVAYYPFNGNANDESGNGYHGQVSGAMLVADRFGNADSAYYFDGVNDIITTQQEHFTGNNTLSVSLWVNLPAPTVTDYFVVCSDFGIFQNQDQVGLAISLPSTNNASGTITYGQWHLLVGTYDGTYIRAYIDGALAEETSWPGTISDPGRVLTFGFFNNDYWEGNLDDVRIYNYVLSPTEIQLLSAPKFVTKWGSSGIGDEQFNHPEGVAVDSSGNVYVTDFDNHRVQKFTSSGTFLGWWGLDDLNNTGWHNPGSGRTGVSGTGDGEFNYPRGIAVDNSSGYVYVTDYTGRIQKFTSSGILVTTWGSWGSGDEQFMVPEGIVIDSSGYVYVTDKWNHRVQKFTSSGTFLGWWGLDDQNNTGWHNPGSGRTGVSGNGDGQFYDPMGIEVDSSGDIYVADNKNHRIQKFTSNGTLIGWWGLDDLNNTGWHNPGSGRTGKYGTGDGELRLPWGVAVDSIGNIYVADAANSRVQKFTSTGNFITKWGTYGSGDSQFDYMRGLDVDIPGNVYVADAINQRIQKFR
jgi:DNA-binding beta-propeller fold protein YncE